MKCRADATSAKCLDNKNAAAIWCSYASQDAKTKGLKPWRYLLIPHDEVKEATDMAGYVAEFTVQPEQPKA